MSSRRRTALGALALGCGLLAYLVYSGGSGPTPRHDGAVTSERTSATVGEAQRPASPAPEAASAPQAAPDQAASAEDGVMRGLRESFTRAPLETLERARRAASEFPDSSDAAERSWIIARCLVSLGRFHEAREEAKELVARSPESAWTIDVQRHLLVNPLDYPSREELQELAKAEAHP